MLPLIVICFIFNLASALMCGITWIDGTFDTEAKSKKWARLTLVSIVFGFIIWPSWLAYSLLRSAFGGLE